MKDKVNSGRHVNLQALEYKTGLPVEGLILTFPLFLKNTDRTILIFLCTLVLIYSKKILCNLNPSYL